MDIKPAHSPACSPSALAQPPGLEGLGAESGSPHCSLGGTPQPYYTAAAAARMGPGLGPMARFSQWLLFCLFCRQTDVSVGGPWVAPPSTVAPWWM